MPKIKTAPRPKVSTLDAALALHRAGYWVVPQDGKRAVALGWDKWRLSEDDLVAYLERSSLNIAIVLSKSDLMDVEADSPEAGAKLDKLLRGGAGFTPAWRSRRGVHRLYKRPPGLPERAVLEVDGIEFRIGNKPCLTTLPPSVHAEGVVYTWLPGQSFDEVSVAPLPEQLLKLLTKGSKGKTPWSKPDEPMYFVSEGRRNDELYRCGCRLLREGLSPVDLRNSLIGFNQTQCKPPLPEAEVMAISTRVNGEIRAKQEATEMGPVSCSSWKELRNAWQEALHWTPGLDAVLPAMLAVCLSTEQQGSNQLFLQLIGEAGSAKTRLCDGLLVSKHCYPLEHLTGFHSGWQAGQGEDFSLIGRINKKTLVTPEGDVLMSSPRFAEIMSQQRRIFDGTSGADYKTTKTQQRHEGLRTPWIMAGTPALLNTDQSRLGDRFIRIIIDPPKTDERRDILRQVCYTELRTVLVRSNCTADSIVEENLRRAYQLTGGYVDYLRARAEDILAQVAAGQSDDGSEGYVVERCMALAEFTADFRARPDPNHKREEKHDAKEMPTRLAGQFIRMASCMAAVLQRNKIDDDVLVRIRKVAMDTARGRTYEIAKRIHVEGNDGCSLRALGMWVGESEEKIITLLRFMRRIGIVEPYSPESNGVAHLGQRWKLTPRSHSLIKEIL